MKLIEFMLFNFSRNLPRDATKRASFRYLSFLWCVWGWTGGLWQGQLNLTDIVNNTGTIMKRKYIQNFFGS